MILVQSPTGNILVNEQNGVVLDEQALRSMARQTALLSGVNPDAFEARVAETTGFDPANMRSATGAFDPQAYFASAVSPGGGPGPVAFDDGPQQPPPTPPGVPTPPAAGGLLPGGYTTPEQRQAELALLQAQIAKLTDPTAKAIAGAQLQQILAQTANIGAGTGASAAVSRQNAIEQLAEQARQYNEQLAFQKAQFDQRAVSGAADRALKERQGSESLAQQNDQFLATLGSKPETLIRYLRALRDPAFSNTPLGTGSALGAGRGGGGAGGANTGAPTAGAPSSSPAVSAAGGSSTPPALAGAPASAPPVPGGPARNPGYVDQPLLPTTNPLASLASSGGIAPTLVPQSPLALANREPGTISINGGGGTGPFSGLPKDFGWVPTPNPLATPQARNEFGEIARGIRGEYAQGGVIPEHVVGVGQDSGQTYEFGEKGTEAVMSNDMLQKLMAVAGKVDFHQKGSDGRSSRITLTLNGPPKLGRHDVGTQGDDGDENLSLSDAGGPPLRHGDGQGLQMMYPIQDNPKIGRPVIGEEMPTMPWTPGDEPRSRGWRNGMKPPKTDTNSYAAGGTIGYSGGKNDYNPQVFNPPDLQGYLQTPGIPLPPQVNMLTGGGQSIIPSAQTLHNALPSEVAIYGDWLGTDANVQAGDAFSLAKRLAPTATGVRTPSYGN